MLAREMLIKEFEYNHWANGRVLDQAQDVTDEQWRVKVDPEGRSLHEILAHSISVERVWRLLSAHGLIQDGEIPGPDQLDAERLARLGQPAPDGVRAGGATGLRGARPTLRRGSLDQAHSPSAWTGRHVAAARQTETLRRWKRFKWRVISG